MNKVRKLVKGDLEIIRKWRNSPQVNRYLFNRHEILSKEHLLWFDSVHNNPLRHLLVYEDNSHIKAFLQYEQLSEQTKTFEWGFYIAPEYHGEGLGFEFAKLMLSYAFDELKAEKVFGQVISLNLPSIKLHKKVGFKLEGRLRHHCFFDGNYQDLLFYGLLKTEWNKVRDSAVNNS